MNVATVDGLAESAEAMHVVFDAADDDRGTFEVFAGAGEIGVNPRAKVAILEERLPVFGREDGVEIDLG